MLHLSRTYLIVVLILYQLFAGRPSLKKLQLWDDEGTFEDPITKAVGRKQYEPQWYGLQTAFSEIERLHHEVTSGGNPIAMDLRTRYVVKGIGKEQTIDSKINIFYDKASGKITKVEDKWDGKLPDSSIQNVSVDQLFSPWWWLHYGESFAWWAWSFTWDMYWWQGGQSRIFNLDLLTSNVITGIPKNQRCDSTEDRWGAQER